MTGKHSRRRQPVASPVLWTALLMTGLLAAHGGTSAAAAPSPAAPSALSGPALLYAMQSTLCASGSAHTDETQKWPDSTTETTSTDLTESGGRQVVTLDGPGYDAPERVTLLSVKGVVYAKGGASALEDLLGVKDAQAGQFADQWIAIGPGQRLGTLTDSDAGGPAGFLSLCGVAQGLATSGATRIGSATIDGQPVLGVRVPLPQSDQVPAGATLSYYVTDERWPRLVRIELHGTGGNTDRETVSRWHEAVTLSVPAEPVPASSVSAAAPSNGQ